MNRKEVIQLYGYMKTMEGKKFNFNPKDKTETDTLFDCWHRVFKNYDKEQVISTYDFLLTQEEAKYGITPADIVRTIHQKTEGTEVDWKSEAEEQFETALNDWCRYRDTSNLSETTIKTIEGLGGFKKLSTLRIGYETDQYRKRFVNMFLSQRDREQCHEIGYSYSPERIEYEF